MRRHPLRPRFHAGFATLLPRVQHLEDDMNQLSKPASCVAGSTGWSDAVASGIQMVQAFNPCASEWMRRKMVGVA